MADDYDDDDAAPPKKSVLDGVKDYGGKVLEGTSAWLHRNSPDKNTDDDGYSPGVGMGIRGDADDGSVKDMADGGDVESDSDSDDPLNTNDTNIDPTTASMSRGLAAVDKVLRYGRMQAGLPSHGVSRFSGLGTGAMGAKGFGGSARLGRSEDSGDFNLDDNGFSDENGFDPNNNGFGSSSSDSGSDDSDD